MNKSLNFGFLALLMFYSAFTSAQENEMQVKANTPPLAYLTHTADDPVVDVDNSIKYFQNLRHNNVDVEMHIYPKGGHGFIFKHQGWINPLFA